MDFDDMRKWLTKNGYTITARTGPRGFVSGHLLLWTPAGDKLTHWPSSPRRGTSAAKTYAGHLRRLGVPLPVKGEQR